MATPMRRTVDPREREEKCIDFAEAGPASKEMGQVVGDFQSHLVAAAYWDGRLAHSLRLDVGERIRLSRMSKTPNGRG